MPNYILIIYYQRMFQFAINVQGIAVLTPSSLLSRHSTHSSDEAGFNDPSLLENLQNNHVSNVRVPRCPPAVLANV